MESVFVLHYTSNSGETCVLGVYSTKRKAKDELKHRHKLFHAPKANYHVEEWTIDKKYGED